MKDEKFEALSALIDGESENAETTLKRLINDADMKEQWTQHYRTKSMMHGEYTGALDAGFASRVSAAVASEPAILAPQMVKETKTESRSQRYIPAVGFAIAATVAVVSVFGLNNFSSSPEFATPSLASAGNTTQPAAVQIGGPTAEVRRVSLEDDGGTHWFLQHTDSQRDPALEARLNMYLADHMEYANASKVQGLVPYSGLVGYDTTE